MSVLSAVRLCSGTPGRRCDSCQHDPMQRHRLCLLSWQPRAVRAAMSSCTLSTSATKQQAETTLLFQLTWPDPGNRCRTRGKGVCMTSHASLNGDNTGLGSLGNGSPSLLLKFQESRAPNSLGV